MTVSKYVWCVTCACVSTFYIRVRWLSEIATIYGTNHEVE